jgi:MFS family permease
VADRRFGASIVASAFGVQALAIGFSISAYPVFMASIESEFAVSRSMTSLGIPALLITGAGLSPWIGRRLDRGSPRRIMTTGALLMMAGLAGLAWAPSFAVAALLWVVLVGAGHAMLGPLPAMTVLTNWFVARRGTMIAIAAMGTTFGGALVPPASELLIGALGWRGAIVCLGAIAALLGVPLVLLGIVKSPEEIGAHPDGAAEPPRSETVAASDDSMGVFARDPRFWLVGSAFSLMNGAGITFLTHTVPLAIERGIEREQAVLVLTVNAFCAALGKMAFGLLTDRVGVRNASRIAAVVQASGWIGVTFVGSAPAFMASAALFSFGLGCMIPCQAGFIAALYGRERFGRAAGVMGLLSITGALVLPPLVGAAYDALGGYDVPMRVAALTTVLPIALFSLVRLESRVAAT